MRTAKTTRKGQGSHRTASTLYLAFELGRHHWKLGFTTGMGQRPRERTIAAGDLDALETELERARRRFGLPAEAEVLTCYEAGRDGFWLHRFLEAAGHRSHVVDSSSIEVDRRARRAKTDALDLGALLRLLIRYDAGEHRVWRIVRVPSPEAEDARHLHRELMTLKRDRVRVTNRMKGLLATQGLNLPLDADFPDAVDAAVLWDGLPLLEGLAGRVKREWRRHRFLTHEIRGLEKRRRRLLRESDDPAVEKVRQLLALRGIGANSAWLYVMEFFGWRRFRNRREVGSLAGLAPTPHQSGSSHREQGIQKAGNRHIRALAIEIAWSWLRYQPRSELTKWYNERFGAAGRRMRKVGIVALARKLLIALWRYLETGAIPEGAELAEA
jgi:transposase